MAFTATAQGRYFKVTRDGVYVSQHLTEREALERAATEAEAHPTALVKYVHEYEVVVSSLTRSQSVVFQAAGAAAGAAAGGSVGENAALDVWGTAPNLSVTWGQAQDFSFATIKPQIAGRVESIAGTALPTGFTLDDSLDLIRYGQGGVYGTDPGATPRVTSGHILRSLPTALADWQARTAAPGVLWAQRFQASTDITRWCSPAAPGRPFPTLETGGIIAGDGCMRQTVPACPSLGAVPGARMWSRPLRPQPGDINQPGIAVGSGDTWINQWNSPHTYAISAYNGAHGAPTRTAVRMGGDLYLQFRVRFSSNRFNAGTAASKMLYVTCNYSDPTQEFILRSGSGLSGALHRLPTQYTNFDSGWNSGLESPQSFGGPANGLQQPGYSATCARNNVTGCYLWQPGVWQTVLVHIRPGSQYTAQTNPPGGATNATAMNTTVEIWLAQPGDSAYTLIHRKTDYVWSFDDTFVSGPNYYPPYGFTWMELNPFTGGGDWAVNTEDWYHEFDQVICSLQPIACPAV